MYSHSIIDKQFIKFVTKAFSHAVVTEEAVKLSLVVF